MFENNYKNIQLDLHLQTSILESLEWDELKCKELIDDLGDMLQSNISPDELIITIRDKYTPAAALIIENLLKEEYIMNGLYNKKNEEH